MDMNTIQTLSITQVIKNQRKGYLHKYLLTPQQINNGMCGDFAEDLAYIGFGQPIWGDDCIGDDWWSLEVLALPDWMSHYAPGHCFIVFDGKFYDSECPQGCDYVDKLPFYQRQLKFIFDKQ